MRAAYEAPDGVWAKAGPAAQAKALAEFDARIAAARISGEIASHAPPVALTPAQAAEARVAERFPSGDNPVSEGLAELVSKTEAALEGLGPEQLTALADRNATELGTVREAEYEADGTTFKRWRVLTGPMQLDRLCDQAGITGDARLKAKAHLPSLKLKAAVGQRNASLV